jgi:Transposase IS66 family
MDHRRSRMESTRASAAASTSASTMTRDYLEDKRLPPVGTVLSGKSIATVFTDLDHHAAARSHAGFRCDCLGSGNHRPREAALMYVRAHTRRGRRAATSSAMSAKCHAASPSMISHAASACSPERSEASRRRSSAAVGPSRRPLTAQSEYCGQHQPLNRQAERYAKEGMPISLSTLADQVGGCTAVLMPLFKRLEAYVLSAERLHGDDTRVPVLAKGKTDTGRIWVYVRDDKPFGGPAPPGAVFYYSRDRAGKHPQAHLANYTGIFQADAYEGYGKLYEGGRAPGPILEAACWVHARRPFFVMADLAENARRKAQGKKPAMISPLALEAVRRIDELFEIERAINDQRAKP